MKKVVIIVAAIVIVCGGAVYALYNKNNNNRNNLSKNSSSQPVTAESDGGSTSINDLLTRNASLKCTFDVEVGGSRSTGIAYFSGAKEMYGEFTNTSKTSTATAYVIRKDDTQYVWQKDSKTGYKADVSAFNKQKQQQLSQQLDPDKKYQFKCQNWDKEESKFNPPDNINFQDISAQLNQAQGASQDAKEAACDAISDPNARSSCKNAL